MPPELLIASSALPGAPPRDPSDRIIAATARDLGATLITRDKKLLDYGKQGYVSVVGC
jgi:PIN domain nuclease of toxin-antitoxin system